MILLLSSWCFAQPNFTPWKQESFSGSKLQNQGNLFQDFNMQQSYSMQYTSGSGGSHSSGIYLNHLSYALSQNVSLYTDIGMYNLFYLQNKNPAFHNGLQDPQVPELLFPGGGIEYRPTENFSISLQFLNMNDAYKAYGFGSGFSPFPSRLGRF